MKVTTVISGIETKNHRRPLSRLFPRSVSILGAAVLLALLAGPPACFAADSAGSSLRVGITPEYPPLVFRQPDGTNGVEIDFAKALGAELNRPVEFVVLNRDDLIPALGENRIDIIMSGMSITKARQLRVAFSEPYLHNQLRAIFRQKDAAQFKTPADILNTTAKVGFIPGTTSDIFVTKNCPNAQREPITVRRDVPSLLVKVRRMDVFIDDTFSLAQIVSENEAEIGFLQEPLSEEDIAWGLRRSDSDLLAAVNRALAKWKTDGTLEKIMDRWIPYLKEFNKKQAKRPGA